MAITKEDINRVFTDYVETLLYAVDLGSRNWGVENDSSDFDIRGIHIRTKEQLFSLKDISKSYSFKFENMDVLSFEVNTFFEQILKGNCTSFDILSSENVYLSDLPNFYEFRDTVFSLYDMNALSNAFAGYSQNNLKALKREVNYKNAFLVIRPLLCARLAKGRILPKTRLTDLIAQFESTDPLIGLIQDFMERKKKGSEKNILEPEESNHLVNTVETGVKRFEMVKVGKTKQGELDKYLESYIYKLKSGFYGIS